MQRYDTREQWLQTMPRGGVVAELGVFAGDFAAQILRWCSPSKLYLVDTWKDHITSGDKDGNNRRTIYGPDAYNALRKRYHDNPQVELLRCRTTEALQRFAPESLDWVYIDADHRHKAVLSDLRLSLRCVRVGGYIAGHDYCRRFPGVARAVRDLMDETPTGSISFVSLTRDTLPSFCLQKNA